MNIENLKEIKLDNLKPEDKWILTKYEKTIHEVKKFMDKFQFNVEQQSMILHGIISVTTILKWQKYTSDDETTQSVLCKYLKITSSIYLHT